MADDDANVWPDGDPDFSGLLAAAAEELAAESE
jgi:hypothetical protein